MASIHTNVVPHLIERGLITFDSAVDGDLMIAGGSSNHRNSRVMRSQEPGFFVKQVQRWEESAIATLSREAACYRLGHNDEDFAPLAPLLPKYYDYDASRHTLVIELLSTGETLSEYLLRTAKYPPGLTAAVGHALAAYHYGAGRHMKNGGGESALAIAIPWIMTICRYPAQSTNFNTHSHGLLGFMQSNPRVPVALDMLQTAWRADNFIHGDLKWDNFIVTPKSESMDVDLKIIDWELAGFGDPCWDVGSVFQSFINFPLVTMLAFAEELPTDLQGMMRYCSPDGLAAIRDFWIGYVTGAAMDEAAAGECIARSIQYCGARMLQTAFEMTEVIKHDMDKYYSDILLAKAYCLTRVAMDVCQNPTASLGSIFGVQQ